MATASYCDTRGRIIDGSYGEHWTAAFNLDMQTLISAAAR
jgi:hypothetical protein